MRFFVSCFRRPANRVAKKETGRAEQNRDVLGLKGKKEQLTVRRSGRYPRLACAAAIPSARRPPDLGRTVDVAYPEATA